MFWALVCVVMFIVEQTMQRNVSCLEESTLFVLNFIQLSYTKQARCVRGQNYKYMLKYIDNYMGRKVLPHVVVLLSSFIFTLTIVTIHHLPPNTITFSKWSSKIISHESSFTSSIYIKWFITVNHMRPKTIHFKLQFV